MTVMKLSAPCQELITSQKKQAFNPYASTAPTIRPARIMRGRMSSLTVKESTTRNEGAQSDRSAGGFVIDQ